VLVASLDLLLLRPCSEQYRTPLQTLFGPQLRGLVVLGHGRNVRRKHDPGLFRRSEDVNVGWQALRFIQRSDANKANCVTGASVVAPHSDVALGTAGDLLALAAVGRRIDNLDLTLEQLHAVDFDQRVQREGSSSLTLAPAAMAAVNEQRRRRHAIAHVATGATAVIGHGFGAHGSILVANLTSNILTSIYGPMSVYYVD